MSADLSDVDHRRIERTIYAYCELVDRAHVDDVAELFTTNAVIDYGYGRLIEGRDRIRDLFRDRLARYRATSHHTSNVTLDRVDENQVTASSVVYAWHQLVDGQVAEVWGRYDDVIVHDDGEWRLLHRRIRAAGWRGFADPDDVPGPFEPIERADTTGW